MAASRSVGSFAAFTVSLKSAETWASRDFTPASESTPSANESKLKKSTALEIILPVVDDCWVILWNLVSMCYKGGNIMLGKQKPGRN
mmetsp:Transcript_17768/g.35740  ORF Transcript_17768/g.35740 Transcript_17768/m.35740 type:complete len:87 (+) Transcript_17768:1139-1399(+)